MSDGKATAYLPVSDLLKAYCHIENRDDLRTVQAKITGHILTLDDALQDTVPAVLALFEALPGDSPFLSLDPLQRRRRTLEALKRVLLRESQVQPLLLVFEDLHWIDTETPGRARSVWSRACRLRGCSYWSTTAPSISTAGAVKRTTPSSASTPSPRRAPRSCSRPSWERTRAWCLSLSF